MWKNQVVIYVKAKLDQVRQTLLASTPTNVAAILNTTPSSTKRLSTTFEAHW